MSLDSAAFPRSPKDLGRWQKWVEDQLKLLRSSRATLRRGSVDGGVVTVHDLLTNPTAPTQFENTDTGTCPTNGADVPIVLSHDPKPGSEQVFYAGLPLKRSDWSRTSTLLTIPGHPWFLAGQPAWVDYSYDGTATPTGPAITSPTDGETVTDTTPTVTGTGSPGYTITLLVDGTSAGTTTVDGTGAWAITASTLATGPHTLVAKQTSPIGTLLSPAVGITIPTATYLPVMAGLSPLWYARLNDPSGSVMTDHSGHGRNGVYDATGNLTLGYPGIIPSMSDTCVDFQSASAGHIPWGSWMDTATIGLVAWITPDDLASYANLLDRDKLDGFRCWQFRISNTGKLEFVWWTTTGGPYGCTGATTLSANDMVAASYDGTTARVYVNGAVDGTTTQSGSLKPGAGQDITVGFGRSGAGGSAVGQYNGRMQGPAIFTNLSPTDVANLWAAGN